MSRIRMTLLENSYDFLNETLRNATVAERRPHAWKFAVLHIVQAIELLLKARLQAEHATTDATRRRAAILFR
jgi:hypothetical protein